MEYRKRCCTILSLLIAVLTLTTASVEVSAAEKKVLVCKEYTQSMTYQMEVSLSSGGSFFDGQKEIVGGKESMIYDLTLGENATKYKEFEIRPMEGYRLVGLVYTEPEIDPDKILSIIDQVKDGKFSLPVKSTKMVLRATFEKIDDGTGGGSGGSDGNGTSGGTGTDTSDGTGKPSTGTSGTGSGGTSQSGSSSGTSAKTGDSSATGWYLAVMLFAAAAITIIAAKKQKNVYKESQ